MGTSIFCVQIKMRAIVLLSLLAGAMAAPESRFLCSECVDEMHKLGHMVKMGAVYIHDYIRDTYCPTLGDHQHFCRESLFQILCRHAVRHCGTLFRGWSSSRLSNWRSL